jgi:hypothetical protein
LPGEELSATCVQKDKEQLMKILKLFQILLLAACFMQPAVATAVSMGQTDTFEDGTTQGWMVGLLGAPHPAPPLNIPTGGPAGTDDNYLLLRSVGGSGAGSKLSVINVNQWAGDYLAAGVSAIAMDLNNFGSTELYLRILVADPFAGPPNNLAFSTDPVILPAGSGWTSVIFPITPGHLTAGLGDTTAALTHATELRLFHSQTAEFPGPAIISQLGVDNIAAVPVPAPATVILLGSGLLSFFVRKRGNSRG